MTSSLITFKISAAIEGALKLAKADVLKYLSSPAKIVQTALESASGKSPEVSLISVTAR